MTFRCEKTRKQIAWNIRKGFCGVRMGAVCVPNKHPGSHSRGAPRAAGVRRGRTLLASTLPAGLGARHAHGGGFQGAGACAGRPGRPLGRHPSGPGSRRRPRTAVRRARDRRARARPGRRGRGSGRPGAGRSGAGRSGCPCGDDTPKRPPNRISASRRPAAKQL